MLPLDVTYEEINKVQISDGRMAHLLLIQFRYDHSFLLLDVFSKLPADCMQIVWTFKKNQKSMKIPVLQVKPEKLIQYQNFIHTGNCIIGGIPPGKKGEHFIEIQFHFGADGELGVKANLKNQVVGPGKGSALQRAETYTISRDVDKTVYHSLDEFRSYVGPRAYWLYDKSIRKHKDKTQSEIHTLSGGQRTFQYKGNKYDSIEQIPDENAQRRIREFEEKIPDRGYTQVVGQLGTDEAQIVTAKPTILGDVNQIWCPECGKSVKPTTTFSGKYKCPQCKFKWNPHGYA